MPRRNDIRKILILGSGPIVIGQAAEFDYSGVQACKVLREEGYEVVLVNSNPATIMTDPEFADATYIEPLLPGPVAQVIERERPDALLATLGGQTIFVRIGVTSSARAGSTGPPAAGFSALRVDTESIVSQLRRPYFVGCDFFCFLRASNLTRKRPISLSRS